MTAGGDSSSSSRGRGGSADFDLNLAPIIDCFTVLIAFLLASASFLSIGIFEAAIPTPSQASSGKDLNPTASLDVVATLQENGDIALTWSGAKAGSQRVSASDGKQSIEAFAATLASLKKEAPETTPGTLELRGSGRSTYTDLIQLIEASRSTFPSVALGGI